VNFHGTATFTISQSCLNLNLGPLGAFIYSTYDCGGGGSGMGFVGAHVDFTGLQTGFVDFLGSSTAILGMYVRDHQVIGVQSMVIGPEPSNLPGPPPPPILFDLLFGVLNPNYGDGDENHYPGRDGDGDLDDYAASVFQNTSLFLISDGCIPGGDSPCTQSRPASTEFVVAEPGSLVLAMGALGVAGLAGLRRRRLLLH